MRSALLSLAALLAAIATPALAQDAGEIDLSAYGISAEDLERMKREAIEAYQNGDLDLGGADIGADMEELGVERDGVASMGVQSLNGLLTKTRPTGCLSESDPGYVVPEPGSHCDPDTYGPIAVDVQGVIASRLPGEYTGRLYEFARDCGIAANLMAVAPLMADNMDGGVPPTDAIAESEMRYWLRLFPRVVGNRSVDSVTADMKRGDTSFSSGFFGAGVGSSPENFDVVQLARPLYSTCRRARPRLDDFVGIAFTPDNSDARCLPSSATGAMACPVSCELEADRLVCPVGAD